MIDKNAENEYFAYFGFGSLVNRKTLSSDTFHIIPATLKGWSRHWQPRPVEAQFSSSNNSIALLSVHQDPLCEIDGLIILDKIKNLKALDHRERGYQKIALKKSDLSFKNSSVYSLDEVSIHLYVSQPAQTRKKPLTLIRSYLDVVMQGYLREYGEAGVAAFIESTKGFALPILEDRHKPVYPRHQPIKVDEIELFEKFLPNQY